MWKTFKGKIKRGKLGHPNKGGATIDTKFFQPGQNIIEAMYIDGKTSRNITIYTPGVWFDLGIKTGDLMMPDKTCKCRTYQGPELNRMSDDTTLDPVPTMYHMPTGCYMEVMVEQTTRFLFVTHPAIEVEE